MMKSDGRPDPEELLSKISRRKGGRGRLKIFFGMSPGVGKTYAMLKEGQTLVARGEDVVIGWMESHGRNETDELARGFETVQRKTVEYRGISLSDMDLDAVLARRPDFALVDELAHTNSPGLRHPKRYQDVEDILDAGINVLTTVNIQHLESIADVVEDMSGARIQERIPDAIFDQADEVQLVDISPEELISRLEEGKVYTADKTRDAVENFFKRENLAILRELSLRHASQVASHQLSNLLSGGGGPLSAAVGQNVLVAVGPAPNSEHLIRWARRFTYNLKAPWICLNVETGRPLSEFSMDCLTKNLTLARNLGAKVVSIPGDNVADAVMDYARKTGVSIIVVGKSAPGIASRLLRRDSLTERIIRSSGKITVVAVQEKTSKEDVGQELEPGIGEALSRQYLMAALSVCAATALNFFVIQSYWSASIFYLATISLLALKLEPRPVFIAACLSALCWNYFFIPPRFTVAISKLEDIMMFLLYFLIALSSGWMTSRLRTNERMLKIREQRMSLINELSCELVKVNGAVNVVKAGLEYVACALSAQGTVVYFKAEDGNLCESPVVSTDDGADEKERSAARFCFASGQATGRFTTTLPSVRYHYVPMAAPGGTIGVLGVRLDHLKVLAHDQESFLLTMSSTISLAVERETLAEKDRKNMLVRESERLSRTLLSLVSHEFRTPLTVIKGSASALLDPATAEDRDAREGLVEEILDNSDKLNSIAENLLSMNLLQSGKLKLKIAAADPGEIVSLARRQAAKELDGRPMSVIIPDDPPPVRCDIVLMIQVIANLLQNAARHTAPGTPVEVKVELIGNELCFSVRDSGPGVKEDELPHIFEKFYKAERGGKGGTGLGLSICRGIVEAHNGTITARNRTGGGLSVEVMLPLDN